MGQYGLPESLREFLERLSIEDLELLLCTDSKSEEMEAFLDVIAEVIVEKERKNPTGRIPDVGAAWEDFQSHYNVPGRESMLLLDEEPGQGQADENFASEPERTVQPAAIPRKSSHNSFRHVVRFAAAVAAAVAVLFSVMIGAQAAGIDVFGALAQWTDDTFHFVTRNDEAVNHAILHDTIQTALADCGISEEYTPTWYPDGFDLTDVSVIQNDLQTSVRLTFSDGNEKFFFLSVDQYQDPELIDLQVFEIKSDSVEPYTCNGKTYYILSNADSTTATYTDGDCILQRIWGDLSAKEIKNLIDSAGG